MTGEKLIEVRDLRTGFETAGGLVWAVDRVSFDVNRGETLAVVGESGCGKSVTSLSIMRLIPSPPGRIDSGRIIFAGRDLLTLRDEEMRRIRGCEISMIFQEPMTSLNPVFTVGEQIAECIRRHQGLKTSEAASRAAEMLRTVGISSPERRALDYPHQLSGGMRQRVMIAMAMACHPKLLIADEPTTALDVTIQAQILELMKSLKRELGMAIMLITHDLGVVAEMADRVIVMYAGQIIEEAEAGPLFAGPLHPYTDGLLRSIPRLESDSGRQSERGSRERLHVIDGAVPSPTNLPAGCRFHPRCPKAFGVCQVKEPPLLELESGRRAACWLHHPGRRSRVGAGEVAS